ncbi:MULTISPECIES: YraN family protein [unclassified Paraburkholderia]|nr:MULTISPECIES: YraN family protein [unclassified Paraburkholderia]
MSRADERRARRETGARFEQHALVYLQRQRLVLVARNVHCRGGELDLVMRDRDGTLVFVEVRARARRSYGGAAASVGWHKRQRLLLAARDYLAARAQAQEAMPSACRFDVVTFEGGRLTWLRDAFRADDE